MNKQFFNYYPDSSMPDEVWKSFLSEIGEFNGITPLHDIALRQKLNIKTK